MIDKRKGQIIAVNPTEVEMMDLETFEQFQLPIEPEFEGQLHAGEEVLYLVAMERRKIMKV
jgi:translation initiation factor 5A